MDARFLFFAATLFVSTLVFGQSRDLETPAAHLRAPPAALAMPYVIEFGPGATIDFADMTQQSPGPLRGYVYVRMQGELVVVPVYYPTSDGTIWRKSPAPVTAGQPSG